MRLLLTVAFGLPFAVVGSIWVAAADGFDWPVPVEAAGMGALLVAFGSGLLAASGWLGVDWMGDSPDGE